MAFNLFSHFISMNNETIPLVKFTVGNLMPELKVSEAIAIALSQQQNKTIDSSIGGIYFHRGSASKLTFFSTQEYANIFITSIESHSMNKLFYFPYNGNNISVSSPEVCGESRIIYELNKSNWHDASNLIWGTSSVLSYVDALNLLLSNYDDELRYLLLDRGKTGDYAIYLVGFQSNAAGKRFISERRNYNEMFKQLNKNLGLEGENLFTITPQPLEEGVVSMEIDRAERMKKSLTYKEYKEAKYGKINKKGVNQEHKQREICFCQECKSKRKNFKCQQNQLNYSRYHKRDPDHQQNRRHVRHMMHCTQGNN